MRERLCLSLPLIFSGFFCPLAVTLMVSKLPPKLGLNDHHNISPVSCHDTVDIIVTLASMTSPFVTTTLVITNPVMSDKPYSPAHPTLSGTKDVGRYAPSYKRLRGAGRRETIHRSSSHALGSLQPVALSLHFQYLTSLLPFIEREHSSRTICQLFCSP